MSVVCAMSEPKVLNVSNNHEIEGCMLLINDHDRSFGKAILIGISCYPSAASFHFKANRLVNNDYAR